MAEIQSPRRGAVVNEVRIKFDVDGFVERLRAAEKAVKTEVAGEVKASGYRIHKAAVQRIQTGTKSGVVYRKYQPRREHQASAPGESPASDTGTLANQSEVTRQKGWSVKVIFRSVYAIWLEFGTRNMKARPFLVPSVEEDKPKLIRRLKRILGI